jgi:hypothetical protein
MDFDLTRYPRRFLDVARRPQGKVPLTIGQRPTLLDLLLFYRWPRKSTFSVRLFLSSSFLAFFSFFGFAMEFSFFRDRPRRRTPMLYAIPAPCPPLARKFASPVTRSQQSDFPRAPSREIPIYRAPKPKTPKPRWHTKWSDSHSWLSVFRLLIAVPPAKGSANSLLQS